jgi:guanylate kinase
MLFLLLGPSGVGKGTQINLLKQRHPEYIFPKSITTRKMRPGESQGNPYHFISDEEFDAHVNNGDFLEWAQVHQAARYGTLRKPIEEALQENKTVIKELDIQGLIQIQKTLDEGGFDELKKRLRSIFIMPPNEETLIKRITERSEIKERELNARLESARREIEQAKLCSSIISTSEDETIEEVYNKLQAVIEAVN